MKAENKSLGARGEQIARQYFQQRGYKIVAAGYRVGRMGEIDLIVETPEKVTFVEVKLRRHGNPEEAVDDQKMRRLDRLAEVYLARHPTSKSVGFDILAVTLDGQLVEKVKHFPDAF
ncbi:MAG: YraN family protein [bacterium]